MGWIDVGFRDVELVSLMQNVPFNRDWLTHMKLYRRDDIPENVQHFKLIRLTQRDGWCGLNVQLIDENGDPLSDVAVCQGWQDGPSLPAGSDPMGGQPPGKNHCGHGGFTNQDGIHGWGWGGGEGFDPTVGEGAHWYWVMGQWTDVPAGFGWWALTNHMTIEPTFQRVLAGGSTEPPVNGEQLDRIEETVGAIATQVDTLEDAVHAMATQIDDLRLALSVGYRCLANELEDDLP